MCTFYNPHGLEETSDPIKEGDEVDFAPPMWVWDGTNANHPLFAFSGINKYRSCRVVSAPGNGTAQIQFLTGASETVPLSFLKRPRTPV
ncbi:MAG TPA: hypothetical protein VHC20_07815 [Candidatus Paceibacterota bacterium]|nr:hypothetical protein [Candidatus Paceibacterota bacterium]